MMWPTHVTKIPRQVEKKFPFSIPIQEDIALVGEWASLAQQ